MTCRRANAIEPGAAQLAPGGGEGGAGDLLGIKAKRHALRRVAPLRQRTGYRFGRELVAEAGEVALERIRRGSSHAAPPSLPSPSRGEKIPMRQANFPLPP